MRLPPSRLTLKSEKSTSVPNKFQLKQDSESEVSDFENEQNGDREDNKKTIIEDNYSDRL